MSEHIEKIKEAVVNYRFRDIIQITKAAVDAGEDPQDILDNGLIAAMYEIGEGFKNNTVFMPQMLIAAKTMQAGLGVIRPLLSSKSAGVPSVGKAIAGSVMGDVHDIGKNLVILMLEGAGFECINLGTDVHPDKFMEAIAAAPDAKYIACSSTMTPTRDSLKKIVGMINALPGRDGLVVMVGGATMDQEFSDEIGADIYTVDAASCSQRAQSIAGGEDKKKVFDESRKAAAEAAKAVLAGPSGDDVDGEVFRRHLCKPNIRTERLKAGASFHHDRLTMKDNVWETLKGEKGSPDRFVPQYDWFKVFFYDPILGTGNAYFTSKGKEKYTDGWGITHTMPPGAVASHPAHGPGLTKITDITKWREMITVPPTKFSENDWAKAVQWGKDMKKDEDNFCAMMMLTGLFERTHALLGMESALAGFFEHPEEMHDLIETLTDWEVEHVKEFCSRVEPEVMFHHDDWGTALNSFLPPDVHRDFYFKPYKRVYDTCREMGCKIVVHHSDAWCANLVPVFLDLKVDIWQGAITANNIPDLIDRYGDRLTIMSGLENAIIDHPGWDPAGVRSYVKQRIDECGTTNFIPCLTRGLGFSIVPDLYPYVSKCINELSSEYF